VIAATLLLSPSWTVPADVLGRDAERDAAALAVSERESLPAYFKALLQEAVAPRLAATSKQNEKRAYPIGGWQSSTCVIEFSVYDDGRVIQCVHLDRRDSDSLGKYGCVWIL